MINKEKVFGAYLGQKVYLPKEKKSHILSMVSVDGEIFTEQPRYRYIYNIDDCKLILRTFDDMTEDEIKTFSFIYIEEMKDKAQIVFNDSREMKHSEYIYEDIVELLKSELPFGTLLLSSKSIEYLISIGIDCFDLIEKGWAVKEIEVEK